MLLLNGLVNSMFDNIREFFSTATGVRSEADYWRPNRPPPPPMPLGNKYVTEEKLRGESAALQDAWKQYQMVLNIVKGSREIGPPPPAFSNAPRRPPKSR
jgi:hypothetical protein